MHSPDDWQIPPEFQPDGEGLACDLDQALASVVSLRAQVPSDAFTAGMLGTERIGHGAVIRAPDLVLTIGYLITEAQEVWLRESGDRAVPAHPLAYDFGTGFGLVQALTPLEAPPLPFGDSGRAVPGEKVVAAGAGGRTRSLTARIVARQEFAGYWEYLIEDAIFTAPAHPNWGGAPLIGTGGRLLGIGSLQIAHESPGGQIMPLNMFVPIDLLKPILDDLLTHGQVDRPPRPWLGIYAAQRGDRVVILAVAKHGPGQQAGLSTGDVVRSVSGRKVDSLQSFYRAVWSLGQAGVEVPLTLERNGRQLDISLTSAERSQFLKRSRLH